MFNETIFPISVDIVSLSLRFFSSSEATRERKTVRGRAQEESTRDSAKGSIRGSMRRRVREGEYRWNSRTLQLASKRNQEKS